MMLKFIILGFLNYRDCTGYEIKQFLDQSTSNFWHAKQSQVYTTLKKIQEEGLAVSVSEPGEGRPDRRVYSITEKGRNELRTWLSGPITELDKVKSANLVKLFFSAQLEKETILVHLRQELALYQEMHQHLECFSKKVVEKHTADKVHLPLDALLWEATRRFGVAHKKMYIAWLEETIAMVEEHF